MNTATNNIPEYIELLIDLNNLTIPLEELSDLLPDLDPKSYLNILLLVFRRHKHTVKGIVTLLESEGRCQADNALALTRKVIEDYIGMEYILLKGKDTYSKRYLNHQIKEQYEYLTDLEKFMTDELIQDKYQSIKEEYAKLEPRARNNTYWAGIKTEDMITTLTKNNVFKERDGYQIIVAYKFGCKTLHTSPDDTVRFEDEVIFNSTSKLFALASLIFSIISNYRLSLLILNEAELLDKNSTYLELRPKLAELIKRFYSI